ncbi:hypothetical protein QCN27_04660 [Cereibacter sp. SYSU M97828]|nr:hypothetical protein [Cereibacter flavus]
MVIDEMLATVLCKAYLDETGADDPPGNEPMNRSSKMATHQPQQAGTSPQQGAATTPSQQQQGQNSTVATQQGAALFRDWASI